MRTSFRKTLHALPIFLAFGALVGFSGAQAQECQDTPEGGICRVQQPIGAGTLVDAETQRRLGLIKISSGCSGTLLNRFWVLTARHCVTMNGMKWGPLVSPSSLLVTADWAPDRAGIPSRIRDFAFNAARTPSMALTPTPHLSGFRDIVLVYLGSADLGPVDSQRIYAVALDQGGGSIILSGRLTTADRVTQYGQGFSTFATGVFGTPTARPSRGLGDYRSAPCTPSSITNIDYELVMNSTNQVGHGGDSGGPTWLWAMGIIACQYVATEPFLGEIIDVKGEIPHVGATLYQRHVDGRIWKYDGTGQCTASACPGWTEIDHNERTRDIVAGGELFQIHVDGRIWKYDGTGQCTASACPGWTEIDHNSRTVAIVAVELF